MEGQRQSELLHAAHVTPCDTWQLEQVQTALRGHKKGTRPAFQIYGVYTLTNRRCVLAGVYPPAALHRQRGV